MGSPAVFAPYLSGIARKRRVKGVQEALFSPLICPLMCAWRCVWGLRGVQAFTRCARGFSSYFWFRWTVCHGFLFVEKKILESLAHSKAPNRVTKKKACASIVLSKSRASIEPRESERVSW